MDRTIIELRKGMNIHPIFHKSLLEKAPQNAKSGPVLIHEETQQPIYDVEKTLDCQPIDGQPHYLFKCLRYDQKAHGNQKNP